jgi:hypothetical protein
VATEDNASDTIVPRLQAADADLKAVHLLYGVSDEHGQRGLDLTQDMDLLEQRARSIPDLQAVIIDPITACLGHVNQNATGAIRAVVTRLSEFAARTGVAVIFISHLNKGRARQALMRATGSLDFMAVARAVFLVTRDPNDPERCLVLPVKNNLGGNTQGLSFRIEGVRLPTGMTPRVVFDDAPALLTADDALSGSQSLQGGRSTLEEAKMFLVDFLAMGAEPATEIQGAARAAGISMATLRRAKDALGCLQTRR